MPRERGAREDAMNNVMPRIVFGSLLSTLAFMPARAEPPKLPVPAVDQSAVAQRGYFYVGGKYVGEPGKEIMQGQIYVEVLAPKDVRRPYPLVLIHGAAQTATNWMGTPDGRKGWAEYFVEQGYIVYMIDQPMRGRSAWHPGDGPTRMFTAEQEAMAPTRARRAILFSTRSMRRRSRPSPMSKRRNAAIGTPARRCSTRSGRRSCSPTRNPALMAG
jgi:pimeloyl-ACP methyl ester carboxylesterase